MKVRYYIPLIAFGMLGLSSCGDLSSLTSSALEIAMADYSGDATTLEYDANGVPIYGYDGDNAVYGYDSNEQPIYDVNQLEQAVSVPDWEPQRGANVVYPKRVHRMSAPPPRFRHRHPLRHRHPITPPRRDPHHVGPGPHRTNFAAHHPLPPNHHFGPGARSERPGHQLFGGNVPRPGMGPGARPDRPHFGPGTRPGRPGMGFGPRPNRAGIGHGPGPRPGMGHGLGPRPGMGHGPGARPDRPSTRPMVAPGNRPVARPDRKSEKRHEHGRP